MTVETIPFSVRTAVFGVLKTLAVKATQSKLDLMYAVESDIPDLLVGDPFRLRQVRSQNAFFPPSQANLYVYCVRSSPTSSETPSSSLSAVKSPSRVVCKPPTSTRSPTSSSSASRTLESESSPTSSTSFSTLSLRLTAQRRGRVARVQGSFEDRAYRRSTPHRNTEEPVSDSLSRSDWSSLWEESFGLPRSSAEVRSSTSPFSGAFFLPSSSFALDR